MRCFKSLTERLQVVLHRWRKTCRRASKEILISSIRLICHWCVEPMFYLSTADFNFSSLSASIDLMLSSDQRPYFLNHLHQGAPATISAFLYPAEEPAEMAFHALSAHIRPTSLNSQVFSSGKMVGSNVENIPGTVHCEVSVCMRCVICVQLLRSELTQNLVWL